jgi:hypothetical protein
MSLFEFIGFVASALGLLSMGYTAGRWHASRQRKESSFQDALLATKQCLESIRLTEVRVSPEIVERGDKLQISYVIKSSRKIEQGIWLGANLRGSKNQMISDHNEDKGIYLKSGEHKYDRVLTIPIQAQPGLYRLRTDVWFGIPNQGAGSSVQLQKGQEATIKVR